MSEKKLITVSGNEQSQLSECLFRYLKDIDVGCEWQSEYLKEKAPSICMKQITSAYKTSINVVGGYTAAFPFAVYYRDKVEDTRKTLDITKPLNKLAEVFEEQTRNKFPDLKLPLGYAPIKLEMSSTPEDESGKMGTEAVFMAVYTLVYKKSQMG